MDLTTTERSALYHAMHGLSQRQIAKELGISLSALKARLHSAKERLGATNTTHAVALAIYIGQLTMHDEGPDEDLFAATEPDELMSTFRGALLCCGLSQTEAAKLLDCSLATIKKWSVGTGSPPLDVWEKLAKLSKDIERHAQEHVNDIEAMEFERHVFNDLGTKEKAEGLAPHTQEIITARAIFSAINQNKLKKPE